MSRCAKCGDEVPSYLADVVRKFAATLNMVEREAVEHMLDADGKISLEAVCPSCATVAMTFAIIT